MADDRIFPLVDRRAPLLDRIRGDGDGASNPSENFGRLVGKFFENEDDEVEAAELARHTEEFRTGLADELDVGEDKITDDVMAEFSELLTHDNPVESVVEGDEESEEDEGNGEQTTFSISDE